MIMVLKEKKKEFTIIVNYGKCSWGKCIFCGWGKIEHPKKEIEEVYKEVIKKINKLQEENIDRIKFFCSGSFLDEKQIPFEFVEKIIEYLKNKNVKEILFETRINDLKEEKLKKLKEIKDSINKEIWFGIGLETSNESLLKKINKPFSNIKEFEEKILLTKEYGFKLRIYILVNIPFDNDIEKNTLETIEFAKKIADEIVIINTYPHKEASIFFLWFNKKWFPLNKEKFTEILSKVLKEDKRVIEKMIEENKMLQKRNIKIEVDFSNYYFIPKFPEEIKKEYKQKYLKGAKIENLKNRVYEMWEEYLLNFYTPPKEKEILFLIPCAARKPYFLSKTHRLLKKTISGFQIYKKMHWVVVSNPGVIPYEFVNKFPFKDYDWPEWEETAEIQEKYFKITKERIKKFLEKHSNNYKLIISFFKPDSLTAKAVEEAIKEQRIDKKYIKLPDQEIYEKVKKEVKRPLFDKRILLNLKERLKEIQKSIKEKNHSSSKVFNKSINS